MVQQWVKSRLLLPVGLAAGFTAISYALIASAPESKRRSTEYVAPLVEVMELRTSSHDVSVEAQGLVGAANLAVELKPQVSGRVVSIHAGFTPGGMIPAGETILQIDTSDYEIALNEAAAKLARAKAAVALEKGQQQIAREEFELLGSDFNFDDTSKALALREPQLKQFEAEEAIAQNAYDRALLELERTQVSLPYDALVLDTSAAMGGVVSSGNVVGNFARADKFWVELRVQQKYLPRLHAQTQSKAGSIVAIQSNGLEYQGEVVGIRADLVSSTRLGGAIVEVTNPLYAGGSSALPPLLIGSHVTATISAGALDNVYEIPRSALLDNAMLYVVDGEQRLQMRQAKVLWELSDSLIIQPTLEARDTLVVSRVSGVAPGTEVRTRLPHETFAEEQNDPRSNKDNIGR